MTGVVPRSCGLEELRRGDEPRFGGKSASLGELIGAGLPVPPGFALSTAAYEASGEVDEALRAEIDSRYAQLATDAGVPEPPVAVRSSAIGEDSATATFAGQQETVLWVRGVDAICAAVRVCWASLYSAGAVSYRERLGGGEEPAMGVTIQLMVDAAVSGVMFTCNPLSGDPSAVAINAAWGLGLAVVGGEVTPDDLLVNRVTGELVRETLGDKRIEYVPDPARPGVMTREVDSERAGARCLDTDAIAALVELGGRIQRHFGSHQDVEWALARTGTLPDRLFVVQSRPITAVAAPARSATTAASPPGSAISMVMASFGATPRGEG